MTPSLVNSHVAVCSKSQAVWVAGTAILKVWSRDPWGSLRPSGGLVMSHCLMDFQGSFPNANTKWLL